MSCRCLTVPCYATLSKALVFQEFDVCHVTVAMRVSQHGNPYRDQQTKFFSSPVKTGHRNGIEIPWHRFLIDNLIRFNDQSIMETFQCFGLLSQTNACGFSRGRLKRYPLVFMDHMPEKCFAHICIQSNHFTRAKNSISRENCKSRVSRTLDTYAPLSCFVFLHLNYL